MILQAGQFVTGIDEYGIKCAPVGELARCPCFSLAQLQVFKIGYGPFLPVNDKKGMVAVCGDAGSNHRIQSNTQTVVKTQTYTQVHRVDVCDDAFTPELPMRFINVTAGIPIGKEDNQCSVQVVDATDKKPLGYQYSKKISSTQATICRELVLEWARLNGLKSN